MSQFAEREVKKYIWTHLSKFHCIRVTQMLRLSCFTETDRQEINAHLAQVGNNVAVMKFFEHLLSREGWLPQFIEALRDDNLESLADELQQVYNQHQLRNSPRSSSSPAVGNIPPSIGSGAVSVCPPAPAEQNPSPPSNPPSSGGAQPSPRFHAQSLGVAPSAAKPALPEISSCHTPVQETDLPSQNSETVAEPKGKPTASNLESSASPKGSAASPSKARVPAEEKKPTSAEAPSATSASPAFLMQEHLGEMPVDALPGSPSSAPPRSGVSNLTQKWDSHPQRPVCVKNGYFGNASHLAVDTGASPNLVAPLGPKMTGNQPVEDYYSSSDNSPSAAPSSQGDSQEEDQLGGQKTQTPQGYQGALGNSSTSTLRRRLDVGQKGGPDQWRNSPTVAKKEVGETPGAAPGVGSPQHFPERGDRIRADAASRLPSSASPRGSSLPNRSQPPRSPSENAYVSPHPITVPPKQSRPPPSDFEGSSSIDVIPPNSCTAVSAAPSSVDFEDLKRPFQDEKWPAERPDDTRAATLAQETVSAPQRLGTAGDTTVNSSNRRKRSFQDNCLFYNNRDDDSLCKPGVLTSVPDVESSGQLRSGQGTNPVYSGGSDRLCLSSESSLSGDPLMLSDSSHSGQAEEKCPGSGVGTVLGRNVMGRGDDPSLQPTNDNQEASGSIRTFGFWVEENASVDLTGAPSATGNRGHRPGQSPGTFSDLATGRQPVVPASSHLEDSSQKDKVSATPPTIPTDYRLLLVGLAVVCVAAFVLYRKK